MANSRGKLEVNVLRAWGLKDTQTFGTQDPYCVVRVNDQRARTRVSVDGGTSPAFHERLTMDVFGHPPHVFVEIWNDNRAWHDYKVGTCTVPLTDDLYAPSGRAQQIITAPVVSAKGKARGTLSLALEFFASARNQQPAATEKEKPKTDVRYDRHDDAPSAPAMPMPMPACTPRPINTVARGYHDAGAAATSNPYVGDASRSRRVATPPPRSPATFGTNHPTPTRRSYFPTPGPLPTV